MCEKGCLNIKLSNKTSNTLMKLTGIHKRKFSTGLHKRKSLLGFTIVELVIVIAVIAILSSVLITTFSNVVEKANASNDISLVRNINNVLEMNGSLNELPNNKQEVRNVLKEYGINDTKNKAKNHIIFWSKYNNMFFIWGIKEQKIIFPEYCRNKTLDDFDDEINMSASTVNNLILNAKVLELYSGNKYCNGYCNGQRLTNQGNRLFSASEYVTTGAISIDYLESKNIKIYVSGASLVDGDFCMMHIFKESDADSSNITIAGDLKNNAELKEWGFEFIEISHNYYVFDCVNYEKYKSKSNGETVYYALSLLGNGTNLTITHNEEIYN